VNEPLTRGIRLFNQREFFECHEVLEDVWRDAARARRFFLQSLIHIAVAYHHWTNANLEGARLQFDKALRKLAGYLPAYEQLDTGALYRDTVQARDDLLAGRPIRFLSFRGTIAGADGQADHSRVADGHEPGRSSAA
jgi:predicted metal-dependent hydrolase